MIELNLHYLSFPYYILIGYVLPVLSLLNIVTNTLVVIVLQKKQMRSPTNVFLAGIAFSDLFTGLSALAAVLCLYTMGNYREHVPYNWCFASSITIHLLPNIFHTASIWITMALTIQRYIYVCHGLKARMWPCTITRVIYCIIAIYVVSILNHLLEFFSYSFMPVEETSRLDPNQTVVTCSIQFKTWITNHWYLCASINTWFKIICVTLIPCTVLVVLNALLISTLRSAERRRMLLLNRNERRLSMRLKESNSTTRMLVVVVSLFLLAEIPIGTINILILIQFAYKIAIFTFESLGNISHTIFVFIMVSCPVNICIYCKMSRQFRTSFIRLFTGHCRKSN